jgi:molybdopterin converting factor small subunit
MRVTIRFRGPISERLSDGILAVDTTDGMSLEGALQQAIQEERYLRETWNDPEEIDRDALILLNGKDIGLTGGLQSILSSGDELTVLPLVHGG